MKNVCLLSLLILANQAFGQWSGSGTNTTTPATEIIINNTKQSSATFWFSPTNTGPTSSGNYYIKAYDYWGPTVHFQGTGDNGNEKMNVTIDGKLGVGTTSPTANLDVYGTLRSQGLIDIGSQRPVTAHTEGLFINGVDGSSYSSIHLATRAWSGSHAILFNAYKSLNQINGSLGTTGNTKFTNDVGSFSGGAGGIMFYGNGGTMDFVISPTSSGANTNVDWGIPKMRIQRNGNVGIGTTTPSNKLDVAGTIRAEEVKVETGWADYVFHEDYDLKSLSEISTYIRENHHLPGIPTAQEVAENGIKLGEMNAKLLEKVEELTLYLIEKDKEIINQSQVIEQLIGRIEKLENK